MTKSVTKTKIMRVVLSGYEDADGIVYESIGIKSRRESPWFRPVSCLKSVERAVCRSQFVVTFVVPTCESWLEYVPLPPRCLCPILFALFPNPAHYRLPASVILQSLNSSHSNLQLFPRVQLEPILLPFQMFLGRNFLHLFLHALKEKGKTFVLHVQKNKVTSVDIPEKLYDWHFRIIKSQITACTDNSRGGMRSRPVNVEPVVPLF